MITKLKIQLTKHTSQILWFNVSQWHPFPRIDKYDQRWVSDDGCLFSQFGRLAKGLPTKYWVALVRDDLADKTSNAPYSLTDNAGFEGNSGTIIYRKKDLGPLSFTLSCMRHILNGETKEWWEMSYTNLPYHIKEQILEGLKTFTKKKEKALRRDGVKALKAHCRKVVLETRANVKQSELLMSNALKNL